MNFHGHSESCEGEVAERGLGSQCRWYTINHTARSPDVVLEKGRGKGF